MDSTNPAISVAGPAVSPTLFSDCRRSSADKCGGAFGRTNEQTLGPPRQNSSVPATYFDRQPPNEKSLGRLDWARRGGL